MSLLRSIVRTRSFAASLHAPLSRHLASGSDMRKASAIGEAIKGRMSSNVARHKELCAQLSSTADLPRSALASLNKEISQLEQPVQLWLEIVEKRKELEGLYEMCKESEGDIEMLKMAEEEMLTLRDAIAQSEKDVGLLLIPKDEADNVEAILLELRAGAGGDEAALFALDLLHMYENYSAKQGWRVERIAVSEGDIKGCKEATVSVSGDGVYTQLKYESGVHRVQRVPATENKGRIHTSTASVAVMPQPEEVDIIIQDSDLKIDTYRSSGSGGQHVNCTDSAVRITHIPTGVVVAIQDERSQHKNKAKALKVLRARIYDAQRQKTKADLSSQRKSLIGTGDRSERIRTYNFPQGRVTDHRINKSIGNIESFMQGEKLDELIHELREHDNTMALGSLLEE